MMTDKTVYEVTGTRRFLLWLLSRLYLSWSWTIRLRMDDETRKAVTSLDEPLIIVMWHNSLFLAPLVVRRMRRGRRVVGLISASRDGAGLAYFFRHVGIGAVRGSSSRFGREAFKDVVRCHRDGHDVTITPDGPRGPAYVMKPGAVLAARRVKCPVLLGGATFSRSWRLKTWDRFFLPVPFSTVNIRCVLVPFEAIPPGRSGVEYLQGCLRALAGDPELDEMAARRP